AKKSGVFDRIILTTDDSEIAEVGREWRVEVPFMRPKELAEDHTPTLPVIQHALAWLEDNESYEPDAVMILQPTTPFRQPRHIQEAVQLFKQSGADSAVGVTEIPGNYNPHWAFKLDEDRRATLYLGGAIKTRIKRRQDLPKAHSPNGAIYLFKPHFIFHESDPNFYGDHVCAYVMDEKHSVNIDSPEDWTLAELMIKKLGSEAV
ncbi:MAG: acylneuraminate cytidylyltransferase family protein, partial [Candidatus Sungbacteria bacterium]|nr:acylneuraminate cytidylyltransferase family protein [Candidatus Sungbacteria bacterium]